MPNLDLLTLIAGVMVLATIVAGIVWVAVATLSDPELERIAEQRGDYEPWTVQ